MNPSKNNKKIYILFGIENINDYNLFDMCFVSLKNITTKQEKKNKRRMNGQTYKLSNHQGFHSFFWHII